MHTLFQESKRHLGSLSSLGGIGVMVKEITEDEDDDKNDENDSTSGSPFRFSLICKVFEVHHGMQNIDYM